MSDGFGVKVNASEVIDKFIRMMDFTQNFMPLWPTILGDEGWESEPWTLRGGVKSNLESEHGPQGESWPDLSEKYKKYKDKHFSADLPKLHLTGMLYESLVNINEFSVVAQSPQKLVYGTSLPYGAAQNFGYSPRNLPKRPYFGYGLGQEERIGLEIRKYIVDAYNSRSD